MAVSHLSSSPLSASSLFAVELFGVFDGHAGRDAATFSAEHFAEVTHCALLTLSLSSFFVCAFCSSSPFCCLTVFRSSVGLSPKERERDKSECDKYGN